MAEAPISCRSSPSPLRHCPVRHHPPLCCPIPTEPGFPASVAGHSRVCCFRYGKQHEVANATNLTGNPGSRGSTISPSGTPDVHDNDLPVPFCPPSTRTPDPSLWQLSDFLSGSWFQIDLMRLRLQEPRIVAVFESRIARNTRCGRDDKVKVVCAGRSRDRQDQQEVQWGISTSSFHRVLQGEGYCSGTDSGFTFLWLRGLGRPGNL